MNKARNKIKLLHWEQGGMVICSKLLESGTSGHPNMECRDEVAETIEWRGLSLIVDSSPHMHHRE